MIKSFKGSCPTIRRSPSNGSETCVHYRESAGVSSRNLPLDNLPIVPSCLHEERIPENDAGVCTQTAPRPHGRGALLCYFALSFFGFFLSFFCALLPLPIRVTVIDIQGVYQDYADAFAQMSMTASSSGRIGTAA